MKKTKYFLMSFIGFLLFASIVSALMTYSIDEVYLQETNPYTAGNKAWIVTFHVDTSQSTEHIIGILDADKFKSGDNQGKYDMILSADFTRFCNYPIYIPSSSGYSYLDSIQTLNKLWINGSTKSSMDWDTQTLNCLGEKPVSYGSTWTSNGFEINLPSDIKVLLGADSSGKIYTLKPAILQRGNRVLIMFENSDWWIDKFSGNCYEIVGNASFGKFGLVEKHFETGFKIESGNPQYSSPIIVNMSSYESSKSLPYNFGRIEFVGFSEQQRSCPEVGGHLDSEVIPFYDAGWKLGDVNIYNDYKNKWANVWINLWGSEGRWDGARTDNVLYSLQNTATSLKQNTKQVSYNYFLFGKNENENAEIVNPSQLTNAYLKMKATDEWSFKPIFRATLYFDLIGLKITYGMPDIVDIKGDEFTSGYQGTFIIKVKNVGQGTGEFTAKTENCNMFTTVSVVSSLVDVGSEGTIYLTVKGDTSKDKECQTCTIVVYDKKQPNNMDTGSATMCVKGRTTTCNEGEVECRGEEIWGCNQYKTGFEFKEDCASKGMICVQGQCVKKEGGGGGGGEDFCSKYPEICDNLPLILIGVLGIGLIYAAIRNRKSQQQVWNY